MEILRDRSEAAINNASERNHYLTLKKNEFSKSEIKNTDEIYILCNFFPHPIANTVMNIKFTPENVRNKIEEMIQFFKEKKLPFLIWLGPSAQPSNLEDEMEKAGIIDMEYTSEMGGMWLDLQRNFDELQVKYNMLIQKTGIEIVPIDTQEVLDEAGSVLRKVFGLPEEIYEISREAMEEFVNTPHSEREFYGYLAYLNGKPVSLSSALLGAGVAGIYNVGTLKEYQKRGIGSAVIIATLMEARKRGYEISIISATKEGFIAYKKLGYIPLPSMKQYVWFPKAFTRFLVRRYYKKQRKKHNYIPSKL